MSASMDGAPGQQQVKELYEAIQQDQGWFFGSTKNVPIKLIVNRSEMRINVKDGIDNKVPLRVFRIADIF